MSSFPNIPFSDYLEQFKEAEKSFPTSQMELKRKAISNFEALGFPTTKNEEWKYTNVANILKNKFSIAKSDAELTLNDIKNFLPEDSNPILLVFQNGRFNSSLSKINSLPKGIVVGNLKDFQDHPEVIEHLGTIAQHKNESFVALNTALFHEGAFVYVEENVIIENAIHLLFINDGRNLATVSYPRNLIVAGKGSGIRVAECYYSIDSANASFTNPVTEIFVGENANVEYCKNEAEDANDFHIDYTSVIQLKNSNLNIHTITSGGKMVRNNLRIVLQEQNASARLNGLYIGKGEMHVDNHTFVDHASPDCYSNEFYKCVLDDKSYGVFNGKIFVRRDAQKTNAYQSNKNILLSDDSSMNAKPQLEIYADDVKCSHGATTGQLDEEAMFYLRSRGIGTNEAKSLLTNAFAEEILDRITITSIREKLKDLIHSKLRKGDS